jgi:hypothetical protein
MIDLREQSREEKLVIDVVVHDHEGITGGLFDRLLLYESLDCDVKELHLVV